jgi:hypothetical protein
MPNPQQIIDASISIARLFAKQPPSTLVNTRQLASLDIMDAVRRKALGFKGQVLAKALLDF